MIGQEVLAVAKRFVPTAEKVEDAQRSIFIEVNGKHVRHAKADAAHCPLARAAADAMELQGALVSRGVIYLIKGNVVTRYVPATMSRQALNTFDETGQFPPGIYRFDPPAEAQRLEQMRHHYKQSSKKKQKRNGKPAGNGAPARTFAKPGLRPPLLATKP